MDKMRIGSVAATLALAFAVAGTATAYDPKGTRSERGLAIAPVKLNLKNKDARVVGIGSYIVNAQGGCNDCHTFPPYAKGGDPFLGEKEKVNTGAYLAGGTPFGPEIVSPNLTPDAKGLPGGYTFKQFFRAIRFGQDPEEPDELLQVMPWPVYSKMTDADILAVYTYLTAIPSAETPKPPAPPKKG
jgi:hypothetical protein